MAQWMKTYDVAGSILGGSIGERLYARLNGYGSLVVVVTFTSAAFRGSIETVVTNAGWVIEGADSWESDFRMTLVRTGPRVVGPATRERFVHELRTLLSSIPNSPVVLEPTFVQPDYAQMPRWLVDTHSENPSLNSWNKHPTYLFGEHGPVLRQIKQIFPDGRLRPSNAASRLALQDSARSADWRMGTIFLACTILGLVTANGTKSAFQGLLESTGFPFRDDDTRAATISYFLILVWPLFCSVLYVLALWIAALVGAFKGSQVVLRLPVPKKPKSAAGWSTTQFESQADNGIRIYMKIQAAFFLLVVVGVSFLIGRMLWIAGSISAGLPGGLAGTAWLASGLALTWFVTRLLAAHLLLSGRAAPRLALNIGAAAVVLALVARLPAWAYLEGVGVGSLVGAVDWTQIVAFTPKLLVLAGAAAFSWLLVWTGKQIGGTGRFFMSIVAVASTTLCLVTVAETELTAGHNLRVQGTNEFARSNYPVAACLKQISSTDQARPVWFLGVRDNQTIVTTRSQTSDALPETGQISSFPTSNVILTLVPFEYVNPEEKTKPCA